MSWQPIETLAKSKYGDDVLFYEAPQNLRHDGIVFIGAMHQGVPCDQGGRRVWPTHWMPLPDPPVVSETRGSPRRIWEESDPSTDAVKRT